jgi:hypothetical protein
VPFLLCVIPLGISRLLPQDGDILQFVTAPVNTGKK